MSIKQNFSHLMNETSSDKWEINENWNEERRWYKNKKKIITQLIQQRYDGKKSAWKNVKIIIMRENCGEFEVIEV